MAGEEAAGLDRRLVKGVVRSRDGDNNYDPYANNISYVSTLTTHQLT